MDDNGLLREYAERASEPAFATLVARHINKVYSVALRRTANPHQAEEITQAVFVILAKKAAHLRRDVIVSGWLYETARLTSITFLRGEIRRARREQEAHMQRLLNEDESGLWRQIAPLLEAGMTGLNEKDRHAVVLRFFDGKSMSEVGAALGANENAAKKRVSRALEKLRRFFAKRGVNSTTVLIAGAISVNSVQPAPGALVNSVTAVAIAKGAAASASTLTLIKGALKFMAWTQAKTAVVAGMAIVCMIGSGIVFYGYHSAHLGPAGELQTALHVDRPLTGTGGYPSEKVAFAILHFGTNRAKAFPILEKAISDKNAEARKQACAALGLVGRPAKADWNLGEASPEAAPLLWKILNQNGSDLGHLALNSLRNIGFQPQDIPVLAALLVRSHGSAISQTANVNASVRKMQNLLDQTSNDQQLQRYIPEAIAETIRKNREAATQFISSVEELLDDTNADVRFGAACALAEYQGVEHPKISRELTAGLESRHDHTGRYLDRERLKQLMAIETLQRIGPNAKSMLPILSDYASSIDDSFMRELAFRAEGHIDSNMRSAIPEVDQALKNDPALKNTNTSQ